MSKSVFPEVRLGALVEDLTQERTFTVLPDEEVTDPTIASASHTINPAGTKLGCEVRVTQRVRIQPGDLVFSRLHTQNGAFAYSKGEFQATGTFVPMSVNEERVDRRFLYWALHVKVPSLRTSDSVGRETYKTDDILDLPIPLPTPAEQRRIVGRIEKLASHAREAQSLRMFAENEAQVLYAKLLDSAFSPYLGTMFQIGSFFRVTTGGTPARSNPAFWEGDVNWISSGEVAFCRIRKTAERITSLGVQSSNAKVYPPGTVLIAMIGQGKTRGQCAILDCNAATNQNVAAVHVYETKHLPEFVYWWFFASYQRSRAVETGTAQPALSGDRVKQMLIPLPSETDQRQVVSVLNALQNKVDALKHLQAETSAELDALLPSVLDRAFKGKL